MSIGLFFIPIPKEQDESLTLSNPFALSSSPNSTDLPYDNSEEYPEIDGMTSTYRNRWEKCAAPEHINGLTEHYIEPGRNAIYSLETTPLFNTGYSDVECLIHENNKALSQSSVKSMARTLGFKVLSFVSNEEIKTKSDQFKEDLLHTAFFSRNTSVHFARAIPFQTGSTKCSGLKLLDYDQEPHDFDPDESHAVVSHDEKIALCRKCTEAARRAYAIIDRGVADTLSGRSLGQLTRARDRVENGD